MENSSGKPYASRSSWEYFPFFPSPKYQKFKIDELPLITDSRQDWTYKELIPYYEKRYGKIIRPVSRRSECNIPDDCTCPSCDAPKPFLYRNNGPKGRLLCKVCSARFSSGESRFSSVKLRCPHCSNAPRPIIGYQISDNRGVGSCILAMRMARIQEPYKTAGKL